MTHVDFSMFDDADVCFLTRQRGDRLKRMGAPKRLENGAPDTDKEKAFVAKFRDEILKVVWDEIAETYEKLRPAFAKINPKRVADIGCGSAFIDLMIYREFGSEVLLIDIEHTDDLWFGFNDKGGAGYASLATAKKFLLDNGAGAVVTCNPNTDKLETTGQVDMAFSLLSCGFHYPADTYERFFTDQVTRAVLLDMRHKRDALNSLKKYGETSLVWQARRHEAILVEKV